MAARLTAYLVAVIVGLTFIAGLIVGAVRDDDGPVDLIVINGRVFTPEAGETAEAVAVQGNRILLVGSNRDVQRLRRAQTVVVDARGGAILPGFDDAHADLLTGGLALNQIDLSAASGSKEVEDTIRLWAAVHPERDWIVGRGWSEEQFGGALPTRQLLDELVPDRPALLWSADGHAAWVNARALALAGITAGTPAPAQGAIVKDPRSGEPTGILREAAIELVAQVAPVPDRDDRLAALRAAITEAHRRGVTSVQNAATSPDDVALLAELQRQGDLDLRVYAALAGRAELTADEIAAFEQLREKHANDPVLKTGAVTLVLDGRIAARSAAMLEPYLAGDSALAEPRLTAEALNRVVAAFDRRGWQIVVHAAGDRAVRMALDAFERAAADNPAPPRGRRHRIEHVEAVDPADLPRFGRLGLTASVQPAAGMPDAAHLARWTAALGPERAARLLAYGSLARGGAELTFGSDWPAGAWDPLLGIHVAVNRTTPEGEPEGGWQPAERLTLREAIEAYTRQSAWASFDEQRKGTLARDMLADLVVLSRDVLSLPPARLADATVAVTIFDGKVVFQRSPATDD